MKVTSSHGCDTASVLATSPYTKRIAFKLGFQPYKTLVWEDISVAGEVLYPQSEHPTATCMWKRIKE